MNPKLKKKIIIDSLLAAALVILMQPVFSGVFAHEWLGVIIGGILISHLTINRQWISAVGKGFFGKVNWKARLNFLINSMMTLAMLLTLVSGALISQYLFTPLAAHNLEAWTAIHSVSSYVTLLIVMVHVALHLTWVNQALKTFVRTHPLQPLRQALVRASLGLLALGAAYSVVQTSAIDVLLSSQDRDQSNENSRLMNNQVATTETASNSTLDDLNQNSAVVNSLPAADSGNSSSKDSSITQATEAADIPTLTQYLSNFTCTACHKHCLLSAPRCSRGDRQVQEYTERYYEEYPQAQ